MLTPQRVHQLVSAGYIERSAKNTYPLVGVVQGYIRFLKDDEKRNSRTAEQSRVSAARAAEIELRTAERANRLIATEEAINYVDEIVGIVKWGLSGLPARVTRDTALRRKIKTEVDEVLTRASERSEQRSSDLRTSGTLAAADAEEDA